jgi:hypothetical protein
MTMGARQFARGVAFEKLSSLLNMSLRNDKLMKCPADYLFK